MKHVVVVVPVDGDVGEVEQVGQQPETARVDEVGQVGTRRYLQLQHHDGDDDR